MRESTAVEGCNACDDMKFYVCYLADVYGFCTVAQLSAVVNVLYCNGLSQDVKLCDAQPGAVHFENSLENGRPVLCLPVVLP